MELEDIDFDNELSTFDPQMNDDEFLDYIMKS